eukprot:15097522-Alexandrium_andersonii.AAC.1
MTAADPWAAALGTSALGPSQPALGWTAESRASAGDTSTRRQGRRLRSSGQPGRARLRPQRGWG